MSEVIVSENDIVKYYSADEQRRYRAYAGSDGSRPRSVKGVEFLCERGLLPLMTNSPKLGLMTYIAGLNWHAGAINIDSNQHAACPQFYVGKYDQFASLPGAANALRIPLTPDPKESPEPKYNRFTMPAPMTLLLAELGLPSNGSKAAFAEPYPDIVDTLLLNGDKDRIALFLGSQVLTKARRGAGGMIVSTIKKDTEELAWRTGEETYYLYREVFPSIAFSKPRPFSSQRRRDGKMEYCTQTQMCREKYQTLVDKTHLLLRKEAYNANEMIAS
jgi:hypothetical protein